MRECENVRMWECENVRMWECENMRIWECENVRMWECENVPGLYILHVTRYTCLRVCWIPRAAWGFIFIDFWRMSVAKPRFSSQSCQVLCGFWRMSLTKWRFPAKKHTMPLTQRTFLNQNCFSRVRLWWWWCWWLSGARSKSRASRGNNYNIM